jgi:hypothetical protein
MGLQLIQKVVVFLASYEAAVIKENLLTSRAIHPFVNLQNQEDKLLSLPLKALVLTHMLYNQIASHRHM